MANLNETPSAERVHIGFFGVRNAGKSSLVNAVTGQDLAVVSDEPGTTTDPVIKAMEFLPVGPVVVVDTPGIDDAGKLGELRVRKAREALERCDVAVLVVDATRGMQPADRDLAGIFADRGVPFVVAFNKGDLLASDAAGRMAQGDGEVLVSARTGAGLGRLKGLVAKAAAIAGKRRLLVGDLVAPGDTVVLVVPIDESAPKGRIILPQQMAVRDILDAHATCMVCQPAELAGVLARLGDGLADAGHADGAPKLVITDSQAFAQVAAVVPESVALTSFSILMARYKGTLAQQVDAVSALEALADGDSVLVSEGCTHHRQCADIGTVKLPAMIREISGADLRFAFTSGGEFPADVSGFKAVVHCGGCMLNDREMARRARIAAGCGVPFANYGMVIARFTGVLARSIAPLSHVADGAAGPRGL